MASGKQVLHVEEACLRLKEPSAPLPHSSQPLLSNHQPHGCSQSSSIQFNHMPSGLALHSFLNGDTHTLCATSPPGSLAGDQKCKAMFWLGSATCSQGSPNHRRRGRGKRLGSSTLLFLQLSFSLSWLPFVSHYCFLLMLFYTIIPFLN